MKRSKESMIKKLSFFNKNSRRCFILRWNNNIEVIFIKKIILFQGVSCRIVKNKIITEKLPIKQDKIILKIFSGVG